MQQTDSDVDWRIVKRRTTEFDKAFCSKHSWSAFRQCKPKMKNYRAIAAGVLPIAKDQRGHIYVLLGRECVGRSVTQSGLWCDFGGGISPFDCSIYGASREFVEETLGCVLGHVSISKTVSYVLQNRLATIQSMFGNAKPYDMHLVRFAYDVDICPLFSSRYDACLEDSVQKAIDSAAKSPHPTRILTPIFLPARAFHKNGQIKQSFKEKDQIQWFRLQDIEKSIFDIDHIGLRPEFAQTLRHHWNTLQSCLKCMDPIHLPRQN